MAPVSRASSRACSSGAASHGVPSNLLHPQAAEKTSALARMRGEECPPVAPSAEHRVVEEVETTRVDDDRFRASQCRPGRVELCAGPIAAGRCVQPRPDDPGLHPADAVDGLRHRTGDEAGGCGGPDVPHHAGPRLHRCGHGEDGGTRVGLTSRHDADDPPGVLVVRGGRDRPEGRDVIVVEASHDRVTGGLDADVDHRQHPAGLLGGRQEVHGFGDRERHGLVGEHPLRVELATHGVLPGREVDGDEVRGVRHLPQPCSRPRREPRASADTEDAVEHDVGLAQDRRVSGENHTGSRGGGPGSLVDRAVVHCCGVPSRLGEACDGIQGVRAVVARSDERGDRVALALLEPGGCDAGQTLDCAGHQLALVEGRHE